MEHLVAILGLGVLCGCALGAYAELDAIERDPAWRTSGTSSQWEQRGGLRRLVGRTGPGARRTARSARSREVTLPVTFCAPLT